MLQSISRQPIIVASMCLTLFACSDIESVKTGELAIAPEDVLFRELAPGTRVTRTGIEIRNVGNGPLALTGLRIEEQDELKEIVIVDFEDYQRERFLEPEDVEYIELEWTALDSVPDQARFIVTLADQAEQSVSVRTPDIDPRMSIQTEPAGVSTMEGLNLTFADAAPGRTQRASIKLVSESVGALDISTLCLLSPEGTCAENNISGGFTLCAGAPVDIDGCEALTTPDGALNFQDEYSFTAFYQAPTDSLDRTTREIRIVNNTSSPNQLIKMSGSPCIRNSAGDVCGLCGNGEIDRGEDCDDGNVDERDGCLSSCKSPICGDGVVSGDEACDDGNTVDTDACTNTCTSATCGDGITQTDVEACDDGNQIDTDACLSDCSAATCGDGVIHTDVEGCDDGNTETETCAYGEESCIICNANCQESPGAIRVCGDGNLDTDNEQCDDGNAITETCAYGSESCTVCNANCQNEAGVTSFCGDSIIDADSGEDCDDGNTETEACAYGEESCQVCNASCQNEAGLTSGCGDEVVDAANGEACDDGNDIDDDACRNNCTVNALPEVVVTLSPTEPKLLDTIECEVSVTAEAGDTTEIEYAWYVDGVLVEGATTSTLTNPESVVLTHEFGSITVLNTEVGMCGRYLGLGSDVAYVPIFKKGESVKCEATVIEGELSVRTEQSTTVADTPADINVATGCGDTTTVVDDFLCISGVSDPDASDWVGLRANSYWRNQDGDVFDEYPAVTIPELICPESLEDIPAMRRVGDVWTCVFEFTTNGETQIVEAEPCPPLLSACGNGVLDMEEACDDGNDVDGDGCDNDCTLSCGTDNNPVGASADCPAVDCIDLQHRGADDGFYWIKPSTSAAYRTHCLNDNRFDGGGWTLVGVAKNGWQPTDWTRIDSIGSLDEADYAARAHDDYKSLGFSEVMAQDWLFRVPGNTLVQDVWYAYDDVASDAEDAMLSTMMSDSNGTCDDGIAPTASYTANLPPLPDALLCSDRLYLNAKPKHYRLSNPFGNIEFTAPYSTCADETVAQGPSWQIGLRPSVSFRQNELAELFSQTCNWPFASPPNTELLSDDDCMPYFLCGVRPTMGSLNSSDQMGAPNYQGAIQFDNFDRYAGAAATLQLPEQNEIQSIAHRAPLGFAAALNENGPDPYQVQIYVRTKRCPEGEQSTVEVCDEIDNDCDGEVDEGLDQPRPGGGCINQVDPGEIWTCVAGQEVSQSDIDCDGIWDVVDNCPETPNEQQSDIDQDGVGDACESAILCDANGQCPQGMTCNENFVCLPSNCSGEQMPCQIDADCCNGLICNENGNFCMR